MQVDQAESSAQESPEDRALGQIGRCLRQGCVICIEHTPNMAPRFTPWQLWGQRCCYNGDDSVIRTEIANCRQAHADHHIRLNVEDYGFHSRFTVTVYNPGSTDRE